MRYKEFLKTRPECPFCGHRQEQIFQQGQAFITYALAPYTKHHLLVVPNRHIESIREMTPEEKRDVDALEMKALDILQKLGYHNATFLVREGKSGDRSIAHVHFHVIPKIPIGDVEHNDSNRHVLTQEETDETIRDIQKSL